jgi:hypothetical protein
MVPPLNVLGDIAAQGFTGGLLKIDRIAIRSTGESAAGIGS